MKKIGFLVSMLWLLGSLNAFAEVLEIPTFIWEAGGDRAAGIYVRGEVFWQNVPCSETESSPSARLQKFPIFKYKALLKEKLDQHEGYYCWNMLLPDKLVGHLVHISLIRVYGKAKLWLNYEQVWVQGSDSDTPERVDFLYHVRSPMVRAEFALNCGESPMCGFRGAFKLRTEIEGSQIEQRDRSLDFFAFSGLAFCFCYHFVFAFLRRRYNAALMIAMMSFALCLRIILSGQAQLHSYFYIAEHFFWRIEIFSTYLLLPSTISMSRAIFQLYTSARIERISWYMALPAMAILLVAKVEWYLPLMLITYLLIFLNILSFIITIRRGFKQKRSATAIFAVTAFTLVACTVLEVINTRINIELIPGTHPLGFLLSSIVVAVLFATRISEAYAKAEKQEQDILGMTSVLNENIVLFDQRIDERTSEIRLLIESLPTGIVLIDMDEYAHWNVNGSYSRFLKEKLNFPIYDWPSFCEFVTRLRSDYSFESSVHLEGSLSKLLSDSLNVEQDLSSIAPERCTWIVAGSSKEKGLSIELRLVWIPIRQQEVLLGVYLFILDITELAALEREAFRVETELGALIELMQLTPSEARELKDKLTGGELKDLNTLACERNLSLLRSLLAKPEQLKEALAHYIAALDLLQRSYFQNKHDQAFSLIEFLRHPAWSKHLSSSDYQLFLKSFAEAPRSRAS